MTDATTTTLPPPPRPPAHVVPTLFNQELLNQEDAKKAFYCFVGTTKHAKSPSFLLGSDNHDLPDIMKLIFEFAKFKPMATDKSDYRYNVKMPICRCVSNMWKSEVEALANKGGWWERGNFNTSPPTTGANFLGRDMMNFVAC
jgi:hypothetical protein